MRGKNTGHETRDRILDVALEMFLERGYHETSMQKIADRLGITKAALYYHFAAKNDIVRCLIEPLAEDIELVVDRAEQTKSATDRRDVMLEGYLDVLIRYRGSLLALMGDVSSTPQGFYERMIGLTARANEILAGQDADLDGRIRATQALSALGDPLVMFPDTPVEELRGRILAGARLLLRE